MSTATTWEWVVESDDGEIIGVFLTEAEALECARQNKQAGNWDAVIYSRPAQ